ncbi:MAG TPA: nitroreductase family protein [Candidatus Paceibacterota bacterium]|nr:nitroreductase family protein [Verrucomicrobiota bacterium]HRY48705.1 nitroreductase family protein [Candidatus Paceibacterota bacterium]HSA02813.1 nitroreductase family protein [Candidatus Paceibacterota bacterium]
METLKAIFTRRSVRRYRPDPIPDEIMQNLLRAAMSAPSAGNEQAWQFVVVTQRALLDRIPAIHPHAQMLTEAQAALLVCGDLQREEHRGYWVQDCSAATENLLLAAHDQGLGAVWVGVYPREERILPLRELFRLPETVIPFSLVPIGYPTEAAMAEDRFNLERVHFNQW